MNNHFFKYILSLILKVCHFKGNVKFDSKFEFESVILNHTCFIHIKLVYWTISCLIWRFILPVFMSVLVINDDKWNKIIIIFYYVLNKVFKLRYFIGWSFFSQFFLYSLRSRSCHYLKRYTIDFKIASI